MESASTSRRWPHAALPARPLHEVFGDIRTLFSNTQDAKMRGWPRAVQLQCQGRDCEACEGGGILTIEMHFLPDIYVPCDVCKGKRYNRETLEVRKYQGQDHLRRAGHDGGGGLRIFANIPKCAQAANAAGVGLGYIQLGRAATTLSGGEAQRVKLANELARRDTERDRLYP